MELILLVLAIRLLVIGCEKSMLAFIFRDPGTVWIPVNLQAYRWGTRYCMKKLDIVSREIR